MNPALFGLGAPLPFGAVLLVGTFGSTIWLLASGEKLVWSRSGARFAIVRGGSIGVMCMLFYEGLARGPVAVVAPVVAAHPALVLAINVLMGVRASLVQ